MNPIRPLRSHLGALQPRERLLAIFAGALIVTALIFLAVEWSFAESQRLVRVLPEARKDLDSIRRHADELRQLRQLPAPPHMDLGVAYQIVVDTARARALDLHSTVDADHIAISGGAPLPALLDWLALLQAEHRLQPLRLDLHGEGALWRIKAELGLPARP